MAGAEADGWETRVHVLEEVVVVGDVELAGVFSGVAVGMANQGAFPLYHVRSCDCWHRSAGGSLRGRGT